MKFTEERRRAIFAKTDGQCHLCRKKLTLKNYGAIGTRGAWEVEHSVAQANGGTHHLNNLFAACISCNRSKGKSSTASARGRNGFKKAPLSKAAREKQAWVGSAIGAVAGRVLLAPLGPVGWIGGGLLGAWIGSEMEPE